MHPTTSIFFDLISIVSMCSVFVIIGPLYFHMNSKFRLSIYAEMEPRIFIDSVHQFEE